MTVQSKEKEIQNASSFAFTAHGVEVEYMIVDRSSLQVRPIAPEVIRETAGMEASDVERGEMDWSNELVAHLIEVKTANPVHTLEKLEDLFATEVQYLNNLLARWDACLLPSGMHPWMDPRNETVLWPHEGREIYQTFDRIFDCHQHGWANVQALHLNLPFASETEFIRLHAAIRLLLPLIPALAASSPFKNARFDGILDERLSAYRTHCRQVPSLIGQVIPDEIESFEAYREKIFSPMFQDITAHDPEKLLRKEWINARGSIARFDRNTIEIRLVDVQECPKADIHLLRALTSVIEMLLSDKAFPGTPQRSLDTSSLECLLLATLRDGERTVIAAPDYLTCLGFGNEEVLSAGEIWKRLIAKCAPSDAAWLNTVNRILEQGCLARRIVKAASSAPSKKTLWEIYQRLADCLAKNTMFDL